ncbi:MAG: phosphatase PAP2 family protein [Anaerolineales bacterium]
MDALVPSGLSITLFIQGLGAWLEAPMKFFSFLGSEEFFLLVLPVVYWAISADLGMRIGFILLFTGGLNNAFKLFFHGPRPYWVSTQVSSYAAETSFGVPSGHAQNAVGVWGIAAHWLQRTWAWAAALFVIFAIGFSRMYLGVHFLHDVLMGWLIGAVVLWGFIRYWDAAANWLKSLSLTGQVGVALGVSLGLVWLSWLGIVSWGSWTIPDAWFANANAAFPDDPINPGSLNGALTPAGALFGLAAGVAWIRTRGGFDTGGPPWKRVVRYLVGLVGVLVIYVGLGAVFPRGDDFLPYLLRFVRYALIGLWIAALAPMLFIRLKLADKGKG